MKVAIVLLCLGCAAAEPLDPASFPAEDAGDPCADCWSACGNADSHPAAIFCSQECTALCNARRD